MHNDISIERLSTTAGHLGFVLLEPTCNLQRACVSTRIPAYKIMEKLRDFYWYLLIKIFSVVYIEWL